MAKAGKKFRASAKKVDPNKLYTVAEASKLLKETVYTKFDPTIDVSINLGVDPKQADQNVRGAALLPHGLGKTVRIVAFAKGDKMQDARNAGADEVGGEELAAKITAGWMDFDQVVATPDMMGVVGRLGKVLGPRGLMPNPKVGTVTADIARAITELKAGRAEFRVDKAGVVHTVVGKCSFTEDKIAGNLTTVLEAIARLKPATSKGTYLQKVSISATMGPAIKIDPSPFRA